MVTTVLIMDAVSNFGPLEPGIGNDKSLFPKSRGSPNFGRKDVGLDGVDGRLKCTSSGETQLLPFSSLSSGEGALIDLGDGTGGKKLPPTPPTLDIL